MDRDAAAEMLVKMLYTAGVEEGLSAFFRSLNHPCGQQEGIWQQAREWHASQTEAEKEILRALVKEAMILAVFGVAVHFDGASGYDYVGERPAEFAVALQIYSNLDEAEEGNPQEIIAICPTNDGENVHDHFLDFVDKSGEV